MRSPRPRPRGGGGEETAVGGSPAIDEAGDEAGDWRPGRANRPRPKPRPEGGNRSRVTRGIEHDASNKLN